MTARSKNRKNRGYATENLLAAYARERGYPHATTKRGKGKDLENLIGESCEIKAQERTRVLDWLAQAEYNAKPGDLPYVVWRPNDYGPTKIDEWVVMVRLGPFWELKSEAGYGGEWTVERTDDD